MFSKLFTGIGESLNPVFIKEMRQYFQNRRMIIFMGILLLAQFICTLFFSSAMNVNGKESSGVGFFLLIIFAGAILAVIICAIGAEQRFAEERSDKELNYAMLTTLRPASIIWGKIEGAVVMLFCIFSMLLPFLTAAYFMRGLSAASLLITICLFPILVLYSLAGIFAGSFGRKWITGLFCSGIFFGSIMLCPLVFSLIDELMDRSSLDSEFWISVFAEYEFAFLLGLLLFLLSLAVISPPKSNRFFAPKVYLFSLPALTMLLTAPGYFVIPSPGDFKEILFFIGICASIFSLVVMSLVAVCEPPVNSIRIYMKCPRNGFGRFLHFLFSSGYAGSMFLTIPILVLFVAMMLFSPNVGNASYPIMTIFISFLGYVILSVILGRVIVPRIPPIFWLICLQVIANIIVWIPFVVIHDSVSRTPRLLRAASMLISPLYCFFEAIATSSSVKLCRSTYKVSIIVTGVLFLILIPFIIKEFRLHHHPEEEVKPPTKEMLGK